MTLQARLVSTVEELASLEPAWSALCADLPDADVFSLPGWHRAWWATMGVTARPAVLVAEDDGQVVGLLPLALRRGGARDAFCRVLEFSGSTQADVHDLVAQPGREEDVLETVREPFAALAADVDVVRLQGIPEGSPLLAWAPLSSDGVRTMVERLPALTVGTLDEMARHWTKSHRGDVGRQTRRLEALGTLALERFSDREAARSVLGDFLAVHTAGWRARSPRVSRRNAALHGFFERLIDELWDEGRVHFSTLTLDGAPISYHYGFLYRGRFYWYKPAYLREYQTYSPGKVHVAKLLAEGAAEGWHTFDFLAGAEAYKYEWSDSERRVVGVELRRSTVLGITGGWLSSRRLRTMERALSSVRRAIVRS